MDPLTKGLSWLAPRLFKRGVDELLLATMDPEPAQAALLKRIAKKLAGSAVARQTGLIPGIDLRSLMQLPITRSTAWTQQLERDAQGYPTFGNERVLKFALTSGTSSAPKKFPITESYLRNWQAFTKAMFVSEGRARGINLLGHIMGTKSLMLMATPEVTPQRGTEPPEGYNSGMITKHTPWILRRNYVPGNDVISLPTWEQKFDLLARQAPGWDLGGVAGLPAVIREFLTRMRASTGRPLGEVWPNMRIILVGGGALTTELQEHVKELVGRTKLEFIETYFATEGQFGHTLGDTSAGLVLNPLATHFQFLDPRTQQRFGLHEVKAGFEGFVVVTTMGGLVNYQIGDLIRVRSISPVRIEIAGREHEEISICGDKLSLKQCGHALAQTLGAQTEPYFSVWVEERSLVFALDVGPRAAEVAQQLDGALQATNPIYLENRKNDILALPLRVEPLEKAHVDQYFQRNLDRGQFKGKRLFATRAAFEKEFYAGRS